MDVKIVYPSKKAKPDLRKDLIYWARYPFIIAALTVIIINAIFPTSFWSAIVLWSLWMVWTFLFSPTLVEFNRTSVTVKTSLYIAILVLIIYLVYPQGWDAIPIIGLITGAGLVITGTLFFSNIYRQKQNIFPLLFFIIASTIMSILGLTIWRGSFDWPMIVVASVAGSLFVSLVIILRLNILREIKKRFHI